MCVLVIYCKTITWNCISVQEEALVYSAVTIDLNAQKPRTLEL